MPKRRKDTEYLSISARIRVMENRLLTRERMERMLEARTDDEAAKILTECGYPEMGRLTPSALDELLSQAKEALYQELSGAIPDPGLVDVFRIQYDYHNAKVLLKSEAKGLNPDRLLVRGGRYPLEALREGWEEIEDCEACSETFRTAVAAAEAALAETSDPQAADLILDRAYYEELLAAAERSPFLTGYVRLFIDAVNLRSAVRSARMGRDEAFLKRVLIPGGNVPAERIAQAKGSELPALFHGGLAAAAALGAERSAPGSGRLTEFERLCDNAVMAYLAQARRIPFGEEPVIGYLYAKESEFTAIRILLSGRMEHLDAGVIRERLRDAYV